jgi:hypothetical protein
VYTDRHPHDPRHNKTRRNDRVPPAAGLRAHRRRENLTARSESRLASRSMMVRRLS